MNRKIKKSRAIEYIILCYAAVLMLLAGPMGLLDKTRVESGNESAAGVTEAVGSNERIQQVFIGDGGYLEKIGVYSPQDLRRQVMTFTVYDELGEVVFSRNVAPERYEVPGFFLVPVEFQTEAGRAYVWQISHPETDVVLGWQNTAESGSTVYGNYYYMSEDEQIHEMVGQNIPMRLYYADPVSFAGKWGICVGIAGIAAFLILLVENEARKRRSNGQVKVQWVFRMVGNPLIAAVAAAGLWAVLAEGFYGGVRADRMVYSAGILVMAGLLLYAVNAKRDSIAPLVPPVGKLLAEHGMDGLQTLFWAGVLWGCIDYVNAMYNIYQDYAYRKVLIFLGLALLSMCAAKYVFHVGNLIWTAASALTGMLVLKPWTLDEQQAKLARLDIAVAVVAGLVLIQLVLIIWKQKIEWKKISLPYGALMLFFFALLIVFRNTRGWPVYMAAAFLLLYLFYLAWDGRDRFLGILCNGIILNFLCALVFAMARRPFRAWLFYRYNFVFHTVTVTAAYLTLVLCALFVRFLMKYHRSRKLYSFWMTALLFGMAASLLLLTLSRTGYLAAVVMGVVVLLYVSLFCYRERFGIFLKKTGVLVLIVLAAFPVTYSSVRLLPPLYDDPYIFELEAADEEWAVHKGDPADSENYITFPRFAYCLDVKLFGDEHSILRKFVDTFMAEAEAMPSAEAETMLSAVTETMPSVPAEVRPYAVQAGQMPAVSGVGELTASAADGQTGVPSSDTGEESAADESSSGPADIADYSNGRMEIFGKYIAQWNLTGHDEMGVELEDGSLSVHAHNTYLQVIHDHGLITGCVYLLLGIVSLIQMFRYAYAHLRAGRREDGQTDVYAALPLAVFLAFAVAGLVEWLFHPCNPLGFFTMAVFAPLLTFKNRKEKVK